MPARGRSPCREPPGRQRHPQSGHACPSSPPGAPVGSGRGLCGDGRHVQERGAPTMSPSLQTPPGAQTAHGHKPAGTSCRMSTRRSEEEASALARSDMHAGPSPGSWAEGPREPLALGTRPQTLTAHCVWAAVWPGWATAGLGGLGPAEGKGKEAQIIQLEGTAAQAKPVHSEDAPTAANDREDSGQCRRGPGPWRR